MMTALTAIFLTLAISHPQHSKNIALTCGSSTSVTLEVKWDDPIPNTDLVYVALTRTAGPIVDEGPNRPYFIRTAPGSSSSITLIDLKPATTYHLRLRSHPNSEPTIAYGPGWRDYSEAITCQTNPTPAGAAHSLVRIGDINSPGTSDSITLSWTLSSHSSPNSENSVIRFMKQNDFVSKGLYSPLSLDDHWITKVISPEITSIRLEGLESGSLYWIKVGESDAVPFRTAKSPSTLYTSTHRISEYSLDVDFLENHDSATAKAMPLYLMTCSPEGNCQPWNKTQFTPHWNECEALLADLCPGQQGTGFNGCVDCVDKHRSKVVEVCGNYTDADREVGYPIHFYCGVGWPEELQMISPITEYCVEHEALSLADGSDPRWPGFAQYISCNSDETDVYNNSARDPMCICWVWDDRMMSLMPASELETHCGGHYNGYVHETICNCTGVNTDKVLESDPSSRYPGSAPIFLPYGYYQKPLEKYDERTPSGENLSFPKNGSCGEDKVLGEDGCKWKRLPGSRIIYGSDLFKSGWDDRFIPDKPGNHSHVYHNQAAFAKAAAIADDLITPRCCGC